MKKKIPVWYLKVAYYFQSHSFQLMITQKPVYVTDNVHI